MKLSFSLCICIAIPGTKAFAPLKFVKPNTLQLRSTDAETDVNVDATSVETSEESGIKPCFWKSPEGMCRTGVGEFRPVKGGWKQRVQLQDLEAGEKLIGQKISNADLLRGKTGPKIFYDCGIGRIDSKGNWQMVSGMLRVAKSFDKASVVRKKVARLSGKPVELYVHKISLDNGRLEVKLSLDELNKELEKQKPRVSASTLTEGQELIGKIIQLKPYGAIVDVGANRNGLLHIQRVADLFDKYINKERGMEEEGLERGASIRVAVKSNEKKRLFLDFTKETKDLAAEDAAAKQRDAEEAAAAEAAAAFGLKTTVEGEEDEDASPEIEDDESAMWAAYADDFSDDFANDGYDDEDADIEDSLGIGSY